MTRFGLLMVVVMCGAAAGCDDSPASPSGTPVVFSALLSPANEVPAIANAESTARGAAQVRFQVSRDSAGAVTGGTATMYFQLTGLPTGTILRGAHIHSAGAGVNGPIVVDTGSAFVREGAPVVVTGTARTLLGAELDRDRPLPSLTESERTVVAKLPLVMASSVQTPDGVQLVRPNP